MDFLNEIYHFAPFSYIIQSILTLNNLLLDVIVNYFLIAPINFHFEKLELNQIAARWPAKAVAQRFGSIQVDISHILGNLITVIFNYQILRKPLKILSL